MSILQGYEKHYKFIGKKRMEALLKYLTINNKHYDEVIYKKIEWEKFEKWYKKVYNIRHGRGPKGN